MLPILLQESDSTFQCKGLISSKHVVLVVTHPREVMCLSKITFVLTVHLALTMYLMLLVLLSQRWYDLLAMCLVRDLNFLYNSGRYASF
jgi:hypothetical protein